MSDQILLALWIGVPFLIGMLITCLTKAPAILIASAMPVAAVAFAFIDLALFVAHTPENSTAPLIIPVSFLFGVVGGVPGVIAGLLLRWLTHRRNGKRAD